MALVIVLAPYPLAPCTTALDAQTPDSAATHHGTPLFTKGDALLGGLFIAGTVAVMPFDRHIAVDLQRPGVQSNDNLEDAASTFRLLGGPGVLIAGPGLYALGRLVHSPRMADLGLHGTEAVMTASAVGYLIKGLVGRARPYGVADTLPGSLGFGRGLSGGGTYSSFPSGHSAAAFAAAAVVTSETARWWPHSTWYVAPVMYGGAALVGLSRVYNNKHWASDVVAGAAIGTLAGRALVRHQHAHPGRLERWLLPTAVVPSGEGGAVVIWSFRN